MGKPFGALRGAVRRAGVGGERLAAPPSLPQAGPQGRVEVFKARKLYKAVNSLENIIIEFDPV